MIEVDLINVSGNAQDIFTYIYKNHPSFIYDIAFDSQDPTVITEVWINPRVKITMPTSGSNVTIVGYDDNGQQISTTSAAIPTTLKAYVKTNSTLFLSQNDLGVTNVSGLLIDKSRNSSNVEQNEIILIAGSSAIWYENWGVSSYSSSTISSTLLMQLVPICSTKSTSYLINAYLKFQGNASYGKAIFDDKSYYIFASKMAIQET